MKIVALLLPLTLAACASSGEEACIVRKPHLARAGILPGQSIPAERDGMSSSDTGAIMWVCANSDKHEDKEVFIQVCPSCSNMNYFYWDGGETAYRCFACMKLVDNSVIKCPECGHPPRRLKTKPVAK
jgi:DNA-directed RNA polymerase subunit RPC12/RpoP